jgi:uncharacterized protein YwgA
MLLFSNSKGHALLAYIIKCHHDLENSETYIGRTHIQKIPYVLKALGVPVSFSYQLYLYGPYSQDITFALDDLLADDVIDDVSDYKERYSSFVVGESADELIEKFKEYLEPHKDTIEKVVEIFSKFSPEQLELFTTLHYIYLEEKASSDTLPSKNDFIETFKKVKGDKFSEKEIEEMLDVMREINFIELRD